MEMAILPWLVVIGLPIAWLISEFYPYRYLRIALGIAAISSSIVVAMIVGSLAHFDANSWYGGASKDLIDASIAELEKGNSEALLKELKVLQSDFQPTYENRARYDELVREFVQRLDHEYVNQP